MKIGLSTLQFGLICGVSNREGIKSETYISDILPLRLWG